MTRASRISLGFGGCVLAAAALDGGFTPVSWGWETLGLLLLVAASALLSHRPHVARGGLFVLAGLAGLALWQLASLAWSVSTPLTALEPQHTAVLVAGVTAALLWLERGDLDAVATGLLLAVTVVCSWNLLSRLGAGSDTGDDAAPIGYTNGLALLAVFGILLAVGAAVQHRGRARLAAFACIGPCATVLVLSQSRGAQAALIVGAGVAAASRLRSPRAAVLAVTAAGVAAEAGLAVAASAERRAYWAVAISEWERAPLLGSGGGTWGRVWLEHRGQPFPALDAHSLYLQALSELGPIGVALLVLVLLPPLLAGVPARSPVARAVLGAYGAFVAHLAVDFSWQLTAVSLTGLALGTALLADGARVDVPARVVLPVAAAAAAFSVALLAGNTLTALAESALRRGDTTAARASARRASALAPWSSEPWRLRGEAERGLGRPREASGSFRVGLERDPGDVELWRALARVTAGRERQHALERALALDPFGARPSG